MIHEQPWLGYFSGYERRHFHFGISQEGACMIHLMKSRKERAGMNKLVKIHPEVCVEDTYGKRHFLGLKRDEGFATAMKAGLDHEEVVFSAMTSGGVKVSIKVKYDGNRIVLDGNVLDRGKFMNEKLYFCYKVVMPAFYYVSTYGKDREKAKRRMKRDRFRLTRADNGKRVSLKVYEECDFSSAELGGGKVTEVESDMDAQEGRKFLFRAQDAQGVFQMENRKKGEKEEPWRGYLLRWLRPMEEQQGREMKPFVIEVK